jgi:hypothetical protein
MMGPRPFCSKASIIPMVYEMRLYRAGLFYQHSYNGSSNPNTEHSYAQSWFDGTAESSIKKADVHHLFITNSSVNSSRSNYPLTMWKMSRLRILLTMATLALKAPINRGILSLTLRISTKVILPGLCFTLAFVTI